MALDQAKCLDQGGPDDNSNCRAPALGRPAASLIGLPCDRFGGSRRFYRQPVLDSENSAFFETHCLQKQLTTARGYGPVVFTEDIEVRGATKDEVTFLQIPVGEPA
jgi:hypothetical protein